MESGVLRATCWGRGALEAGTSHSRVTGVFLVAVSILECHHVRVGSVEASVQWWTLVRPLLSLLSACPKAEPVSRASLCAFVSSGIRLTVPMIEGGTTGPHSYLPG